MTTICRTTVLACVMLASLPAHAENWPQFRGPGADNTARERSTPVTWSATDNVAWRVPLPGPGNASPIVWEDRVFVAQALNSGRRRGLLCFDRNSGELLWQTFIPFEGDEPTHEVNPYASATPATDGRRVYCSFGSAGLAAIDFDGRIVWERSLGPIHHQWGNGSSPVLFQDMVIQLVGPGPVAAIVAVDKHTGETIYNRAIPEAVGEVKEFKGAWSTPVITNHGGQPQMIVSLPGYLAGFNPQTGQEYWRCAGLTELQYTSPIVTDGVAIAMSGYKGAAIATRLPDALTDGDITDTHRLWRHEKSQQRIGTGVIFRDLLYICDAPGILRCYEWASGKLLYEQRLNQGTWGSTMLAGGRIYVTDNQGTTYVVSPGPEFKLIATNALGSPETTRSSPAFSDGQMFIRTYDHLWCIGTRVR